MYHRIKNTWVHKRTLILAIEVSSTCCSVILGINLRFAGFLLSSLKTSLKYTHETDSEFG